MKPLSKAARKLAWALALAFLFYYFTGSAFWGEPAVSINFPPSADPNSDLPLKVCVRARHANFEIVEVRFDWDRWERFSAGENSAVRIHLAYQRPRREYWTNWELKRLTYPRTRCMSLAIPLGKFRAEGMAPADGPRAEFAIAQHSCDLTAIAIRRALRFAALRLTAPSPES